MKPLFLSYELVNPRGRRTPFEPAAAAAHDAMRSCVQEGEAPRMYGGSDTVLGGVQFKRFAVCNGDAEALRWHYNKEPAPGRDDLVLDPAAFDIPPLIVYKDLSFAALFRAVAQTLPHYERTGEERMVFSFAFRADDQSDENKRARQAAAATARLLGVPAADILDFRTGGGG